MTPLSVLDRWITAFNRHDLDDLIDCYDEHAINHQVAAGDPVHGREAIRTDMAALFEAFPDVWAKAENLMEYGSWAAWEWVGGGTLSGPFFGAEPTGRSYELRGCGFFRVIDGRIQLQRGYWDKTSWLTQLGVLDG
jgi:steroid delta-isomerase-like uncharacterized protein